MTNSISRTIGHVQIEEQLVSEVASNPLANIWLGFLALILMTTLFCSAVLMAWPIVAQMIAG